MKNCIKLLLFLIKYLAFWVAFFFFIRAFFLLYNYKFSADLSFLEIWQTFRYGFSMDLASSTYLSFFPVFVMLFAPFIRTKILTPIIFVYSLIIIVAASILGLLDIGLYEEWGMRLSPQILPALENPKGMLACVTGAQLVLLFLVEIGVIAGFLFLYHSLFKSHTKQEKQKWWSIIVLLLYGASLIIPMRGGLQLAPLNLSSVSFSPKQYANYAATNPYWSLFNRLIYNDTSIKELSFMDQDLCNTVIHNSLNNCHEDIATYIKPKKDQPVNVLLIILESFSNKVIEPLGGAPDIAPNFSKLAQEGILFKNFYAAGNRSDKGLGALLAAYPAMIGPYSILHFPEKMENLDFLSQYFTKKNYETYFYYAGETEFYNTKNLVLCSDYDHIISVNDFPASAKKQKWGVPDALFYKKISEDIQSFTTPFFLVTYNISLHSPYDVPGISERNHKTVASYSDQCLYDFVMQLKKNPFWDNTLLIITADHGTLGYNFTSQSDPVTYQIPMLWMGGVIDTSFVNENIGMQTDLTTTLVQQLGWKPNTNPFSKNLFGKKSYSFYFSTEGYGFIAPELAYYLDTETHKMELLYTTNEQKKDSLMQFSKSFVQFLHHDFKKR
jgi:phosphoglycerol transferase MdoB-like AlkP superfamily enzyme